MQAAAQNESNPTWRSLVFPRLHVTHSSIFLDPRLSAFICGEVLGLDGWMNALFQRGLPIDKLFPALV